MSNNIERDEFYLRNNTIRASYCLGSDRIWLSDGDGGSGAVEIDLDSIPQYLEFLSLCKRLRDEETEGPIKK